VTLEEILAGEGARISPLSRYILAHRAGRADLSKMNRAGALSQHQSCPLYRVAARRLLSGNAYPSTDLVSDSSLTDHKMIAFSRN
jgi:ribosomal protein L19E